MTWIHRGGINLFDLTSSHWFRIIQLTEKFDDIPVDLADATLIVVSEETGFKEIVAVDNDFYVYRDARNRHLKNVYL